MKPTERATKKSRQIQETDSSTQAGRDAFERHAWREAFDLLTAANSSGILSPEDLEHLGDAAWWTGRMDECIDARERAFAGYLEQQEPRRASFVAFRLASDHQSRRAQSVAFGWLGQAARLLENEPECPEHGYLAYAQSFVAQLGGDLDGALEHAKRAFDIGNRLGDRDLQALGLEKQGAALVAKGQVTEGLALLDEAMAAAVSGELGSWATGLAYCQLIGTCSSLVDYQRASEWTEALRRWCDRQSIVGFPGICRVHRAEIMRLRGAWAEAEKDARFACDELQRLGSGASAGAAFRELGSTRAAASRTRPRRLGRPSRQQRWLR
ncbi:MAG: hypothetical protein IIB21_01735 [Chloroflexi bacterium]|nr:hypothetical protein [Chloroflexota bacterium]